MKEQHLSYKMFLWEVIEWLFQENRAKRSWKQQRVREVQEVAGMQFRGGYVLSLQPQHSVWACRRSQWLI